MVRIQKKDTDTLNTTLSSTLDCENNNGKNVDKDTIARSFLGGQTTYDEHAVIQHKVSESLVGKLKTYQDIRYDRVLEVGCCTGALTEMVLGSLPVKNLYLNDLVEGFYETVLQRLGDSVDTTIEPLFGDIESLDIPKNLDLVISSSTFQWLTDLSELFKKVSESLDEHGFFVFSMFGPGTLLEFKEITGVGLNYKSSGFVMDLIEKYFHIEEEGSFKDILHFSTPREVLKHIQATGVGGVQKYRWTSSSLMDFEKQYSEKFGTAEGLPVTYMSMYLVASKKI